jgi:putative endopeptidase
MRTSLILASALAASLVGAPTAYANKQKPSKVAAPPAACSDFYGHINTGWLRSQLLPPGVNSASRWSELQGIAGYKAREWLEGKSGNSASAKKLSDLYASASVDDKESLKPYLSKISSLKKPRDVANYLAQLHAQGIPVLFNHSSPGALSAGPGLIGSADAYKTMTAQQTQAYTAYVQSLAAISNADANIANSMLNVEKAIFSSSANDPLTLNRKDASKRFGALRPGDYLSAIGDASGTVSLQSGAFAASIEQHLNKISVKDWQHMLRIWVANQHAEGLNNSTRRAKATLNDALVGSKLSALSDQELKNLLLEEAAAPLWNSAYVENLTGDQVSYARQLAESIRGSAIKRVRAAGWIPDADRSRIEARLSAISIQIGAASNAGAIAIKRDALASNLVALKRWRASQDANQRTWLEAQTQPILAFDEKNNRVLISAALLQSPVIFNNESGTDYGAFGALLAQELAQIAIAESNSSFRDRGKKLATQYSSYTAVGSKKINGNQTLPQNIADLAALEIALDAMHEKMNSKDADKAFFAG